MTGETDFMPRLGIEYGSELRPQYRQGHAFGPAVNNTKIEGTVLREDMTCSN